MMSFYQAYQTYERRWARGEMEVGVSPRACALCLLARLLLRLAGWLLRAGHALQQRYGPTTFPPFSSSQEKI